MRFWIRNGLIFFILLAGGLGWCAAASAYVLQPAQLMDLMMAGMGKAGNMRIVQRMTLYGEDENTPPVTAQSRLWYLFPEKFRSEVRFFDAERIHLRSGSKAVTVFSGQIIQDADSLFDRYKDPLLFRDIHLFTRWLKQVGIDTEKVSLGRFDGRIGYVLGADYPDESVPQLWLDKKTFRPMRLIAKGRTFMADSGPDFEIRYLNWHENKSVWYPETIRFVQNGRLVRELKVDKLEVNASFDKGIFDPDRLRALSGQN